MSIARQMWPRGVCQVKPFWRSKTAICNVVTDRVATIAHECNSGGLSGCDSWVVHIALMRPDGEYSRLCNRREVMERYWSISTDVLAILSSGRYCPDEDGRGGFSVSGSPEKISGHRLCGTCDFELARLYVRTLRKAKGELAPEHTRVTPYDRLTDWISEHQDVVNAMDDETLASLLGLMSDYR